jgi:superfamily II DNA or RNA helicase
MLKEALSQMADAFLPPVLMYGYEYQQKGHVLNIRLSDGLLKARVKGNSNQIYNVYIDLKSWPTIPARCSCRSTINCKHAAASLFAMQLREKDQIPLPTSNNLSLPLDAWLRALSETEQKEKKQGATYEVAYLLEPQFDDYQHRVVIRLAMRKCLKKGGLGKKTIFNTITESRRQYFKDDDEQIIAALLFSCGSHGWFEHITIRNADLLSKILVSKRAYLAKGNEPLLNLGAPLNAKLNWQLTACGSQFLSLEANGKAVLALLLDKVCYFDSKNNRFGLLMTPYSPSLLKKLLTVPPVNFEEASLIAQKMAETNPELPRPKIYATKETQKIKPQAVISFAAIELNEHDLLFVIHLSFDYEGIIVANNATYTHLFRAEGERLLEIQRDLSYEKEKYKELNQILAIRHADISEKLRAERDLDELILAHYKTENDLLGLHKQVVPLLKKKGWRVEFAHPIYNEPVDADELKWFSEINEEANDFFSYQLGILIDGKQVSIVPLVAELIGRLKRNSLDSLSDNERVKLPLPEGKVLHIALGRIKPLIRLLLQYGVRHLKANQTLRISRYQFVLMQETEQALIAISARWQGCGTLRNQLRQLTTLNNLPAVALPQGLTTTLRDYQQQGLNWLQLLRTSRFAGILADDMGLGKTIQTLAHLQVEKEQGRLTKASLIIVPTSLVGNWFAEAKRFTPELKVLVFHGSERHSDDFENYDLIISTYGLILRDKSRFIDYPFYYLILDEAQWIKNERTKTTQIILQIQASHRLCLSGTPLENHLGELWSLFHFLMPGLLGDAKQFKKLFKIPIEKFNDTERKKLLAKRVQPFLLRRSKNQVASELPDKTEMIRTIELMGSQRDLYEAIRMSMEKKVREAMAKQGMGRSHIVLLDALLKLRQVCCDPKLLSMPEAEIAYGNSAKLDALMELLESLVDEGRRVLVFSQFTSMLRLIEEQLIKQNYGYLKLTGQTQNRQALVNTFQEGKVPIFLISLKAGGTGLNLTRADTIIHYDPWWNPSVEDQATDRSHRIGQDKPVFVYKLITSGTVEEAILAMQDKKRQLFEGILSDNAGGFLTLTDSDVEQFFMPLSSRTK